MKKLLHWLFGGNSIWCKITHLCYRKKITPKPPSPPPPPQPPSPLPVPPWPQAPNYNGHLIGMTAYSLIKYPIEDIEWFLRELVAAGGNATEALLVTTWDDTWALQPYRIARFDREKWKKEKWNPDKNYGFPVFDLTKPNIGARDKWLAIFNLCKNMGITIMVRIQDFCSRKDNFLERHWCYFSCLQSHRWGGSMSGGYWHWPPGVADDGKGHKYIWPHYSELNNWLVKALIRTGVKFYIEPWNELSISKGTQAPKEAPDAMACNVETHRWFVDDLVSHGAPIERIICNPQQVADRTSLAFYDQAARLKEMGVSLELHGCASPQTMRQFIEIFGSGRRIFPNGDGVDKYAKGINDGRKGYTEPSLNQAREMGGIVKANRLLGYCHKGRKFRKAKTIRVADFTAVKGLAEGLR